MTLRTIKLLLLFSPLFFAGDAYAYRQMTREEYIALHKEDAIRDMKKTGVPASITLAQALLESEDGNSSLAREANNHFGIKCTSDWKGAYYTKDDDKKDECFRKYKSVLDSYDDHSYFLKTRPRYAFLFELNKSDYKQWAKGLKKSGYATNPRYADELIKIIEDFQLYKLDDDHENLQAAVSSGSEQDKQLPIANRQLKSASPRHEKKEINYVDITESRNVMSNNGVPYIIAKKGDSYEKIAKEYELMTWLIYKYNDASKDAAIKEGQIIYIKPKHRSTDQDFYVVKEGDTMQSISQQFGIKMKMLYKRNKLEKGTEVQAGEKLWLNKNKT